LHDYPLGFEVIAIDHLSQVLLDLEPVAGTLSLIKTQQFLGRQTLIQNALTRFLQVNEFQVEQLIYPAISGKVNSTSRSQCQTLINLFGPKFKMTESFCRNIESPLSVTCFYLGHRFGGMTMFPASWQISWHWRSPFTTYLISLFAQPSKDARCKALFEPDANHLE